MRGKRTLVTRRLKTARVVSSKPHAGLSPTSNVRTFGKRRIGKPTSWLKVAVTAMAKGVVAAVVEDVVAAVEIKLRSL